MLCSLGSKLSRKTNLGQLFIISAKKTVLFFACSMTIFAIAYFTSYTYTMLIMYSGLDCVFSQYMHTNIFEKISSLLNEKLYPRMQCARLALRSPA